jgi:hypothetical protein
MENNHPKIASRIGEVSWRLLINLIIFLSLFTGALNLVSAQSIRVPELRSCLTTELAYAIPGAVDIGKSDQENFDVGQTIGYVVAEFYQTAIWALDDAQTEGLAIVTYALQNWHKRAKFMKKNDLAIEVRRCRKSFQ